MDAIFSKDPNYYILIELKEDDDNCTRQVYEICKKQNIFSHSLILSFHPRQLQLLKEWDPSIFIQCFPPRYLKCPVDENLYGPVFNKICLWTKEATNEEIEAYHKKNVVVDICAVDNEDELNKALTLNCDSITTNSPDVIYPLLRKLNLR